MMQSALQKRAHANGDPGKTRFSLSFRVVWHFNERVVEYSAAPLMFWRAN